MKNALHRPEARLDSALCTLEIAFHRSWLLSKGDGEVLSSASKQTCKAGWKTPPGELPAAFPGTPGFGTSSAFGNELGKAGNKASKKYSWLCHLGVSFLHQHGFTWVADRDSGQQFSSLLSLSKVVGIVPQLMDKVVPGSRAALPGCSQAPIWGAGDAENAPVQNKPSGGEILF